MTILHSDGGLQTRITLPLCQLN